jgi:hypothetical protein
MMQRAFMKSPSKLYEIPIPQVFIPSRFFMTFRPSLGGGHTSSRDHLRCVMLFNPNHDDRLARLEGKLHRAEAITSELMSDVLAVACVRFGALGAATKAKVNRLIEVGAWTDATLALLELELPQWKLRRLVDDDGEWLCSLSKQPGLPLGYDEVAEASHEILPVAVLIALLQARRAAAATTNDMNTVPQIRPASGYVMCCDNFF